MELSPAGGPLTRKLTWLRSKLPQDITVTKNGQITYMLAFLAILSMLFGTFILPLWPYLGPQRHLAPRPDCSFRC